MPAASSEQPQPSDHSLVCMEIWGGSQSADTNAATPGLDLWVYSRPHGGSAEGGGDVHYVSLCSGGIITRFLLADVSGHGASVAATARSLRDLMRRNINRRDQSRLVQELNAQFGELAKLRRFATAVVATYLTTGDRLTVSNAGHPRPLWYRAAAGAWSLLGGGDGPELSNLPLGIDADTAYTTAEVALGRGDLVLFYTDAVTETPARDGRLLGEAGLLDLVRGLDVRQPAKLTAALLARLEELRGGPEADDDLTLVLLHHNGGGPPRLGLWESLGVYARMLGLRRV